MRASEFITEQPINDIKSFVLKNCQQFLKEIGGIQNITSKLLFRGTNASMSYATIVPAYTDRKPLNTSNVLHKAMSQAMHELGIRARRDNSLFVTSDQLDANQYGEIYVVIPIGDFSFSWSNIISDFYGDIVDHAPLFVDNQDRTLFNNPDYDHEDHEDDEDYKKDYSFEYGNFGEEDFHHALDTGYLEIVDYRELKNFVKDNYRTDNLQQAIQSGNEIMIHAERCLLIRKDVFAKVDWNTQ